MTDKEQPESPKEPVSPSVPTPVFTEVSAEKPTSAIDVDALVAKTVAALEPLIDKKVQSVKDKRIDQLERRVGRADLEDLGVQLTPEQELRLRIRDLEARQPVQQSSLASGALNTAPVDKFDVSAFAKEKGIDLNNADAIRIVQTPHSGPDALKADLLDWKLRQFTQTPDAAAAPAMQGGALPPPDPKTDAQRLAELYGSANAFSPENVIRKGGGVGPSNRS